MRITRSNTEFGPVTVVDDDPQVCDLAGKMLEEEGFRVVCAEYAQGPLGMLQRNRTGSDALFPDMGMPGPIDGTRMAAIRQVAWPEMTVVVAAGAPPGESADRRFAPRPWRADEVVQAVRLLARRARGGDRPKSAE
jgi:DNA-binding NtrC family response regulator